VNKLLGYTLLGLCCLCAGIFFFLVQREFIIIQWSYPSRHQVHNLSSDATTTRTIKLYCWDNERTIDHETSLIWHRSNPAENLKTLVSAWINLAHSEHILSKLAILQDAPYATTSKEAYLSFDQSILDPTWSIRKKIFVMQSLLKTISKTDLKIQHIVFLVNHQPMIDEHLDFSYSWPLDGFIPNF
jgi:hypothetical protein